MALVSRYSVLADKTYPSPSSHYIATPSKTESRNPFKNLRAIQRSYQKLWPSWADTQGWRPDILVTQWFYSLPNENSLWKPCKNLSAIPRSDKKLWPFSADTVVWSTSHPRHRVGIPYLPHGKQPLETPVKIQAWSNGRIKCYDPFEPIHKVGDQTSSSLNCDSIAYPTKTSSGNPCKNLSAIPLSDQKLWPFSGDALVRSTRHPRHRVGIPYIPHENQPLETPVKILAWSNGRIKCYGPFEPILKVGDQTSFSLTDSTATPTKTASGSPCKHLNVIQRSDQKLWPFWPNTQGWRPDVLVTE